MNIKSLSMEEYLKRYMSYLNIQSKYSHIEVPMTYHDLKLKYIEIHEHFTNVAS